MFKTNNIKYLLKIIIFVCISVCTLTFINEKSVLAGQILTTDGNASQYAKYITMPSINMRYDYIIINETSYKKSQLTSFHPEGYIPRNNGSSGYSTSIVGDIISLVVTERSEWNFCRVEIYGFNLEYNKLFTVVDVPKNSTNTILFFTGFNMNDTAQGTFLNAHIVDISKIPKNQRVHVSSNLGIRQSSGWHLVNHNAVVFLLNEIPDTEAPTGTFSINSKEWDNQDVLVNFNPDDGDGSGVLRWRYRLSPNAGASYGAWSNYIVGDIDTTISLNSNGQWKIEIETEDNKNNIGNMYSGIYKIDKTAPIAPIINVSTTNWTNQNVNVTINHGIDNESGIKELQYKINTSGTWTKYTSSIPFITEGIYTLYARNIDNAGNVSVEVSETVKIDKSAPNFTVNTVNNIVETSNKKVIIQIRNISDNYSGAAYAQVSENSTFSGASWIPMSTPKDMDYILSKEFGMKTIYVRMKDNTENISNHKSLNIELKADKPNIPQILNKDNQLFITGEEYVLEWKYSDPNEILNGNNLYQSKAEVFFENIETLQKSSIVVHGSITSYSLNFLKDGVYNMKVEVYNSEGKSNASNSMVVRKNRFNKSSIINTIQFEAAGSNIKYIKLVHDSFIPSDITLTVKVYYDDGTGFSPIKAIDAEFNKIIQLPSPSKKLFIEYSINYIKSVSNIYIDTTSIIDKIQVYGL